MARATFDVNHSHSNPNGPDGPDIRSEMASPWASRWARMARPLELAPTTPVAVALSGGADSVFLLHLVARSVPRPKVLAIHVDHGLRGDESRTDAEFCARLCARVGIPFARRTVELEPGTSNLEARARELRYRALAEEATSSGIDVVLTGHHEDDAVETLLMRWMRGTDLAGLPGLRRETVLGTGHRATGRKLRVLRPLSGLRREEVRSALRLEGLEWREDSSNQSPAFTRNRVRHEVLPEIEAQCGEEGVENFFEFARAVESLEDELADRTAHIHWEAPRFGAAHRAGSIAGSTAGHGADDVGGEVRREALTDLSQPLLRRALGRLIGEGTGRRPSRDTVAELAADLSEGRTGRREVHGGWSVQLRTDALHLNPPVAPTSGGGLATAPAASSVQTRRRIALGVPGEARLGDGRVITATPAGAGVELDAGDDTAFVDAAALDGLHVRFERPGDRIRPLGAPGHKPLRRFLGELGIPREERGNVPLVVNGNGDIVWVAGIRPAEGYRVTDATSRTVRLTLGVEA